MYIYIPISESHATRLYFEIDMVILLKKKKSYDISVFHITASWYLNKRSIKILNLTKNNSDQIDTSWSQKKERKNKKNPF